MIAGRGRRTALLARCAARCAAFGAVILVAATALASSAASQSPFRHWTEAIDSRFATSQPVIAYTLRVDAADAADTQGFAVTIDVRGASDTVLLAMAAHPEYDDRYWRFVRDVRVDGAAGRASVAKADSAVWRVVAPGGSFALHYRLVLPPAERFRSAWRPFVAPTGALVGGIHSFMYVVGETLAPLHVRLDVPDGWSIATGLTPTSDPRTFYAPSAAVLVESPMLVGRLRDWRFTEGGVPHRVVYWPAPDTTPFDSAAIVDGIRRIVRGTIALFGRAPYREYAFLLQDGSFGALEHANSVTLGAPARSLAEDPGPFFEEVGHEYFHAWNLMRIRPAEYGDVSFRTPQRSRGLWFSEGLSMFYADLLLRRAGLPVEAPTRPAHLQALIGRYLASPGNARLSAERVSEAAYGDDPGALGDYSASPHVQGELIGAMLDLEIRHATGGRRSVDDVMRLMLERFSGERGFTGRDVEHVVNEVCGCNVTPFFDAHVRGGSPIPFDAYLRHAGLRADVAWRPAVGSDGRPVADLRAYPYDPRDESGPRLAISNPESAWGRAGLHTGDRVRAVNGQPMPTADAVRRTLRSLRSGDTVRVEVERAGTRRTVAVVMAPFTRPVVELRELPAVTAAQRDLRARWEAGAP
jgi:predicted metalloprotease with PDZ domain